MPSLTATDAASRTTETPKRKGWVDRNDTADETQDAAEVAAERTKKSVKSKRQEGAMTAIPEALALAPAVIGSVVKDTYKKGKALYDRKYDTRKSDDEED